MILDYSQYIEFSGEQGIVNFKTVNDTLTKLEDKIGICPFCKKKINNLVYDKTNSDISWCRAYEYEKVIQCQQCGWWEHSYTFSSDDIDDGLRARTVEVEQAVLRTYDVDSKNIPIEILNKYIKKNPDKIYGINDKKMEELVASVFNDFGKYDVTLVGKSHDGGKDLILLDGDKQTFVQVKRRTKPGKVEPVSSIRELIGAAIVEGGIDSCVFVTTADHFSLEAKKTVEKIVKNKTFSSFELIDFNRFISMLKLQRKDYPKEWDKLLKIKGAW